MTANLPPSQIPDSATSLMTVSRGRLIPATHPQSLETLVQEVLAAGGQPMDYWEVAARLESFGLNDQTAQKLFQQENLFALASILFTRMSQTPALPARENSKSSSPGFRQDVERFSRALSFALPWGLLFISEHGLGSQLPLERRLQPESAAAISVAIMLSLVVSGGFLQVMARRGLFYQGMKETALERAILLRFLKLGGLVCGGVACAGTLLGFYTGWIADQAVLLAAGCFLLLSGLWLLCGVLSVRASAKPVVLIFCGSIGAYLGLTLGTNATVAVAQMVSFLVALLAAAGSVWWSLARGTVHEVPESLPDMSVLGYLLTPYFLSGVGYFTFLFTDRWLAGTVFTIQMGVPFTAHPGYQLGADLALLGFFPMVGLVEVFACRFATWVFCKAEERTLTDSHRFRQEVRHRFHLLAGILMTIGAIPVAVWFAAHPEGWQSVRIPIERAIAARCIAFWAGIGTGAVAVALFEMLILFSFSVPRPALRALLTGCLINAVTGYLCGNLFGYEAAVCGLVTGAMVWAVLGWRAVRQLLNELEYRYFAM
ncbi:MAG: hypothetical protein K1Y36_28085 [Blastocatellia bacterium]|nr:hypothetical protein [Blastocatellia bacterium]